ncbi:DUF3306 domain-containing protein [Vreelandella gomseomensis]|uniref:DUF3306 domain-containing protein n=1 Tax=Vreelandella gomseomensis TaxID=370766 RepID=A0ABU1GFJ1_9GAMM|nr:DUF3306 domain-containing protein [Halomonas gomseomensis]MDR5876262.1 DUF3306 domain-containing protein [Halomonas gomseomensis]
MSRLERWSRIKRGLEPDEPSPDASHEVPAPHDAQPPPSEARSFDDTLESDSRDDANETATQAKAPPPPGSLDDTLPDPDTLAAGSDFSGYMVPGVSAALRRRALKRLWSTGNYNVRDGLDDYDMDYTQQLKPMATDLAGKLRRWVKKADESLDTGEEDASIDEPAASTTADNQTTPSEAGDDEPASAQRSTLDDQSDNAQTKA